MGKTRAWLADKMHNLWKSQVPLTWQLKASQNILNSSKCRVLMSVPRVRPGNLDSDFGIVETNDVSAYACTTLDAVKLLKWAKPRETALTLRERDLHPKSRHPHLISWITLNSLDSSDRSPLGTMGTQSPSSHAYTETWGSDPEAAYQLLKFSDRNINLKQAAKTGACEGQLCVSTISRRN